MTESSPEVLDTARRPRAARALAWLSTLGLGAWFMVGFPFGNHNESYYWAARFEHAHAWDVVWTRTLAATFRPGGQAIAYIGWWVSGGESWPVQLFNFAVAACALWATALAVPAPRTFAFVALVGGGAFFAGYIYLFHLHGVFYSPVLALIAALLHLRNADRLAPWRRYLAAGGCALAVGVLFHPYALMIFLGYLAGQGIERWRQASSREWLVAALTAFVAGLTLLANRPEWHRAMSNENLRAFLASYALIEIFPAISVLSGMLAVVTAAGIAGMDAGGRRGSAVATALGSGVAILTGVPVTLLWVAVAVIKLASLREWSLAGMTAVTAVLPVIATSGSPTYAIFAIMMSTIALAWRCPGAERLLRELRWTWVAAGVVVLAAVTAAVRIGIDVPVVSRVAAPLVAEREKTWQLEGVLDWMLASEYRGWRLTLDETIANPVDAGHAAIDRRSRPPTYQPYLDAYLAAHGAGGRDGQALLVTFGTRRDGMTVVKAIPGRYAGDATVFK